MLRNIQTTTTTITATTTETSDVFKLRIYAPNSILNGKYIRAGGMACDEEAGAHAVVFGFQATKFSIAGYQNRGLKINDGNSDINYFNGDSADDLESDYRTLLFTNEGYGQVKCTIGPSNELWCVNVVGDQFFEYCNSFVRMHDGEKAHEGCTAITLFAVSSKLSHRVEKES